MITDAIIGMVHSAVVALLALLPDAPPRPGWLDGMMHVLNAVDYLLPASEIFAFMPTMLMIWGALLIWRFVRSFLPGG